MARTLDEDLAELPPERRARIEARSDELIREMALHIVREASGKTQRDMARLLGISQPQVSKLEQQHDMLLSTLRGYIEAAGGTLHLRIGVPGAVMTLDGLSEIFDAPSFWAMPEPRTRDAPPAAEEPTRNVVFGKFPPIAQAIPAMRVSDDVAVEPDTYDLQPQAACA